MDNNEPLTSEERAGEHYEVWVSLERWVGDDKQEDCEATKITEALKREDATVIWELLEAIGMGAEAVVANNYGLSMTGN